MADTGVTNWPATDDLDLPSDKTIAPTEAGDGNYVFIELLRRFVGILRAVWTDLTQGMTHDLPMGSHKITGLATPSTGTDAATKAYVDAVAQGLSVKQSVKGASTTNHSVSAFSGTTIDGGSVSLSSGDRILLKDQSTASQNGIWVFNGAGSALTRPTDFAHGAQEAGAFVFVESGTTNGGSGWVLASTAITVDTTAQTWTQFSGAGEITAGTGMTKSGNTLNVVANADGTITVNADDIQVAPGGITNAQVNAGAAIAKSKLAALAIVDADVSAISESKITNLTTDLAGKAGVDAYGILNDSARPGAAWDAPTGTLAETVSRSQVGGNSSFLTSGKIYAALCVLPPRPITNVIWRSATTPLTLGSSDNHLWVGIADINGNILALSADDTAAVWAANSALTKALTAPYTPGSRQLGYILLCVAVGGTGGTLPSLATAAINSGLSGSAPVRTGNADTLSPATPPTLPFTMAALTANGVIAYGRLT